MSTRKVVAAGDARDRAQVIELIVNLSGSALGGVNLWLPAT